jgi:hypothetical protein
LLSSATTTPIARVPASAAGEIRSILPSTASRWPFDADLHLLPGAQQRHLVRAHRAGELERGEIHDRHHLLLGAHLFAGDDVALADDAEIGASRLASRTPIRETRAAPAPT